MGQMSIALGSIRTIFKEGTVAGRTDGELLTRFVDGGDAGAELAFEALVTRHGPMVLRVCRTWLADPNDADDAAQATFLVLARKAGSIRQSGSVASWLFGVATRVASRERAEANRRRRVEAIGAASRVDRRVPGEPETWPELYEELDRLPDRYRRPIILFHLEGLTYEETAKQVGCPVRTVQTRLSRGRERLRVHLARRGLTPQAVLFLRPTLATLRPDWASRTSTMALRFAAGSAGTFPASVAALAEGALKAMIIPMRKVAVGAALALGVGTLGVAGLASSRVETGPSPRVAEQEARAPAVKAAAKEPRELKNDDGKSAGMRSIAGGGHAVKFESPGEGWKLTAVRIYGSRYGYPQAPNEDFKVYLCDDDFKPLATFAFPYSTFERGDPEWVTMDLKPTSVPARFIVCVGFDPAQTKGVYVHHDAEASGKSLTGLPGAGKPRPFVKGDWLIRAVLSPPG